MSMELYCYVLEQKDSSGFRWYKGVNAAKYG